MSKSRAFSEGIHKGEDNSNIPTIHQHNETYGPAKNQIQA
jgi:hypothetical protein